MTQFFGVFGHLLDLFSTYLLKPPMEVREDEPPALELFPWFRVPYSNGVREGGNIPERVETVQDLPSRFLLGDAF